MLCFSMELLKIWKMSILIQLHLDTMQFYGKHLNDLQDAWYISFKEKNTKDNIVIKTHVVTIQLKNRTYQNSLKRRVTY